MDQTVLKGDNATFRVQAKSVTRITYQWMKNGNAIPGATDSFYTVIKAKSDAVYFVKVANAAGSINSSNATLHVVNLVVPPVCSNDSYTILERSTLTVPAPGILGNDVTAGGSLLTAQLETDTAHGTLRVYPDGSFTYNPQGQFSGTDTFTYRATDGVSTSAVATVTINVAPINDPPVAHGETTNTVADTSVTIDVLANDTDPEGAPLTVTAVFGSVGTMVSSGTNVLFTPPLDFSGIAIFTYTVSDGQNSRNADVVVSVLPRAEPEAYSLDMNTTLAVSAPGVLSNDSGSAADALQVFLAGGPGHGTVTLNPDGSFAYSPDTNYFGTDSFTYSAQNASVTSAVATVSLTIRDTTPVRVVATAHTTQGFTLIAAGPQVSNYVILRSTNLLDWTPIATNAVTDGTLVFTDSDVTNQPLGFYRVRAE